METTYKMNNKMFITKRTNVICRVNDKEYVYVTKHNEIRKNKGNFTIKAVFNNIELTEQLQPITNTILYKIVEFEQQQNEILKNELDTSCNKINNLLYKYQLHFGELPNYVIAGYKSKLQYQRAIYRKNIKYIANSEKTTQKTVKENFVVIGYLEYYRRNGGYFGSNLNYQIINKNEIEKTKNHYHKNLIIIDLHGNIICSKGRLFTAKNDYNLSELNNILDNAISNYLPF